MTQKNQVHADVTAILLPEEFPSQENSRSWIDLIARIQDDCGSLSLLVDQEGLSNWESILGDELIADWVVIDDLPCPDIIHFRFSLLISAIRILEWSKVQSLKALICSEEDPRAVFFGQASRIGLDWASAPLIGLKCDGSFSYDRRGMLFREEALTSPHEYLWKKSLFQQRMQWFSSIISFDEFDSTDLHSAVSVSSKRKAQKPLVTVCVTHYNYGEFLAEQLFSLRNQTYSNLQVIVVDDASTDPASVKAFKQAEDQFKDKDWIFSRRKKNGGILKARATGLDLAQGTWILFADADNISGPDMIEKMINAAQSMKWDLVSSHCTVINRDSEPIDLFTPTGAEPWLGAFINVMGDNNSLMRKSLYQNYHHKLLTEHKGMEDWELLFRLKLDSVPMGVVPERLFQYRRHDSSITAKSPLDGVRRIFTAISKETLPNGLLQEFLEAGYLWMLAYEQESGSKSKDWETFHSSEKFWSEKEQKWVEERDNLRAAIGDASEKLKRHADEHIASEKFWSEKEQKWVEERDNLRAAIGDASEKLKRHADEHIASEKFWSEKEQKWVEERNELSDQQARATQQIRDLQTLEAELINRTESLQGSVDAVRRQNQADQMEWTAERKRLLGELVWFREENKLFSDAIRVLKARKGLQKHLIQSIDMLSSGFFRRWWQRKTIDTLRALLKELKF